jgi:DNA-binding transcriptional ArsR family regulator
MHRRLPARNVYPHPLLSRPGVTPGGSLEARRALPGRERRVPRAGPSGHTGGGVVHTQSQHIFLALAAVAMVAGPLGGAAAAMPGDDGDITVAVDGSVRSQHARSITAPTQVPGPVAGSSHDVALRMRTNDVVLQHPAGAADDAAPGLVRTTPDGLAVGPDGGPVLPWYYMMDDREVRPYHALFWDTGTAWYFALGDDLWATYAGLAPGAPGSPTPLARGMAPDVWLRTQVEEIDLVAQVQVALRSTLASTDGVGFARPDAPAAPGVPALPGAGDAFAPHALGLAALAAPTPGAAAPAGPAPMVHAAQTAAPTPLLGAAPLQAAAAGALGLLLGGALYHLIRKNAILKNKVRGAIADHVFRHPGSTITEIAQSVGVTHQTASYHLRLLQEHGLVLGVERGNKRLYFRNDGSFNNEERGLVAVLRDPESMRVLELIRQNPWIMKNEAAASLGVSRNTLNWHLQKLLSAGLVSEARENGHCFLFCNRRAAGEVLTQVVQKVEERRAVTPAQPAPKPVMGDGMYAGAPVPQAPHDPAPL